MQSIRLKFYGAEFILVLPLVLELSSVLFSDYRYLKLCISTCDTSDRSTTPVISRTAVG